ncbi:MAG: ATP-binding protein [Bacteroidota bacterium]
MIYLPRVAEQLTREYLQAFPVVGIAGPRQSGKSTMLKHMFSDEYQYVTFDDFQVRQLFYDDPVRFMRMHPGKVIFDEVQYIPELFPQIKMAVDDDRDQYGRFILTGSGQFLLGKYVSESLAGRIGLIPLLPFQFSEIPQQRQPESIYKGGYPELVTREYTHSDLWYRAYIETYLQKDLRQLMNITDLHAFGLFIRSLAVTVGQTLNLSSMSRDIGVAVNTLRRWLSVLEASYLIFSLHPYHVNLGKRMIKSPKVYFYDTGLLDSFLGIATQIDWEKSLMYGPVFENYIISEVLKAKFHSGNPFAIHFIRTSHGDEIDLVMESGSDATYIEIKASYTYKPHFHNGLTKLLPPGSKGYVIYQGESIQLDSTLQAVNYRRFLLSI